MSVVYLQKHHAAKDVHNINKEEKKIDIYK
jgi:hypothetical protein